MSNNWRSDVDVAVAEALGIPVAVLHDPAQLEKTCMVLLKSRCAQEKTQPCLLTPHQQEDGSLAV